MYGSDRPWEDETNVLMMSGRRAGAEAEMMAAFTSIWDKSRI
jgi:hypothetical protein